MKLSNMMLSDAIKFKVLILHIGIASLLRLSVVHTLILMVTSMPGKHEKATSACLFGIPTDETANK